jgi:hypothetical protein
MEVWVFLGKTEQTMPERRTMLSIVVPPLS